MRRVHASWHIAALSLGILIGIALSQRAHGAFGTPEWVVLAVALFSIALIKRTVAVIIFAVIAGCLLGMWRGSVEYQALNNYQEWYGKHVVVHGAVSEDTSIGKNGDQRMRLSNVSIGEEMLPGSVWVSTPVHRDIKRGDTVHAEGLLTEGFGTMPASMYRAKLSHVERPQPGDVGRQVRDWFSGGVYRALPPEHAGLGLAYLVGQKQTVSEELSEQFRTIGLIHAVVASGFHLTVLVLVVRRLFGGISKYLTALSAALMIIGFIAITGLSPSMSRAGLITGLSLLAWYYGRAIHPFVLLPFAAAVTALFRPAYVWGDIGWYLSFAAFAGVIIIAPLVHDYFWGTARPGIIRTVVITTIAAQLATLPLTILVFEYYSVWALLANLLVVPLVPLVMLLVFLAGMGGLLLPSIAPLIGWPARAMLEYMIRVVEWVSALPYAKTEVTITMPALIAAYVIIGSVMVVVWRITHHNFRKDSDVV